MAEGTAEDSSDQDEDGAQADIGDMMDTTILAIRPMVGVVMAGHLSHMGPKSLFNLTTALNAMRRDDIEGSLTIYVTAKKGHSIEVEWRSGQP